MKGKTILITGATSGIGKETALALSSMGARVVFTTRDVSRGEETCAHISERSGNPEVHAMFCRLDSFRSIQEFSNDFKRKYKQLHVLINNAGAFEIHRKLSADGIELTFAVNHLAPFLMTHLLLDNIRAGGAGRIINVSSGVHKKAMINFGDIEFRKNYHWMRAYSQSKLANVLFTFLLSKKMAGTGVTVNCLHPGMVLTNIYRDMNPLLRSFFRLHMLSPRKGAETSIFLASSDEVKDVTGAFFEKKKMVKDLNSSCDTEAADRLWQLSAEYARDYLNIQ